MAFATRARFAVLSVLLATGCGDGSSGSMAVAGGDEGGSPSVDGATSPENDGGPIGLASPARVASQADASGSPAAAAREGGSNTSATGVDAAAAEAGAPASTGAARDAEPPLNPVAALGRCTGPTGAQWSDAQAAYAKWKRDLVTTDGARGFVRVRRPNSTGAVNTSNSEGTAYGMILAVAMDDPRVFEGLWGYEQLFRDANGLMNWEIDPTGAGTTAQGTGAATDADEDMAFALLWADHRWGGHGSLSDTYRNFALGLIDLIWKYEVDHIRGDAVAPGDQFPNGAAVLNISYFAPAYYRLFGTASGKQSDWNKVVESSYSILAATINSSNKNATNGLVPAWSTPSGTPQAPNPSLPTNHQLDSCRTPFRIGQDECWYGELRAKNYLAKIDAFYSQVGASHIVNGYNLDGTPNPASATVFQSAAFVGTAGAGAMSDPAFSTLRDQAYAGVATLNELDGSIYYTESWTALSLVMMNGGFWNPTGP